MATEVPKQSPKTSLSSPLMEKFGTPLFWIAVGYGLGFFHGNTSGKRKSLPAA